MHLHYIYITRDLPSRSCSPPLSVAEVTLRNAVDDTLVQMYGATWHKDETFRKSILTPESLNSLEKAIERTRSDERGQVVAELTFDFWSNLFRTDYAELWRTKSNITFPGLAHGEGRSEIQSLVRKINGLRNRVAHHEPILDMNAPDLHSKIIKIVKLRCEVTANWMRHYSTVGMVMRSRPNLAGTAPITLAGRADKRFALIKLGTKLVHLSEMESQDSVAYVCKDNGVLCGAFTPQQLANYLMTKAP